MRSFARERWLGVDSGDVALQTLQRYSVTGVTSVTSVTNVTALQGCNGCNGVTEEQRGKSKEERDCHAHYVRSQ